jgi:chromosome segregation ATPase
VNPKDVKDWVWIGVVIVGWVFSAGMIWARLNSKIDRNKEKAEEGAATAKREAVAVAEEALRVARAERESIKKDIDGLGGRLKRSEDGCASLGGRMDANERQVSQAVAQAADVQNRLGRVEGKVEGIDAHVTEMKLELFQHLGDIKALISEEQVKTRTMITDRDTNMRERMARVEERKGIPHTER